MIRLHWYLSGSNSDNHVAMIYCRDSAICLEESMTKGGWGRRPFLTGELLSVPLRCSKSLVTRLMAAAVFFATSTYTVLAVSTTLPGLINWSDHRLSMRKRGDARHQCFQQHLFLLRIAPRHCIQILRMGEIAVRRA